MQISYDQDRTVHIQTRITEYEAEELDKIIRYMQRKNITPDSKANHIKYTKGALTHEALSIFIQRWTQIIEKEEEDQIEE